jgi:hypothetical protein
MSDSQELLSTEVPQSSGGSQDILGGPSQDGDGVQLEVAADTAPKVTLEDVEKAVKHVEAEGDVAAAEKFTGTVRQALKDIGETNRCSPQPATALLWVGNLDAEIEVV